MQAIGIQVIKNDPIFNVLYISSETFTNELVECDKYDQNNNCSKENTEICGYTTMISSSGRYKATQEEFFHTPGSGARKTNQDSLCLVVTVGDNC